MRHQHLLIVDDYSNGAVLVLPASLSLIFNVFCKLISPIHMSLIPTGELYRRPDP